MDERGGLQNLTGVWSGLYTYSSGVTVMFTATLIDSGRTLSGATHESSAVGRSPGMILNALLSGSRQDSAVGFLKTYDDPLYYPVRYEGGLNADATEIEGRWQIGDGSSGKFLMIRSTGKSVAIEQRKHVKI